MNPLFDPNYQRGGVLPIVRDKRTGERSFGAPQFLVDLVNAAMLPGDVYKGNVLLRNPETGNISDEVIKRSADLAGAMTLGAGAIPADKNSLRMGAKIRNHKGQKIDAPRVFYRGENPGDTRRIKTGADVWDSHLFVSSDPEQAKMYGSQLTKFAAAPDAKIAYEGTKEWRQIVGGIRKNENLLQYADRAAKALRDAGYDAAWFKMQGNVGTAVFDRSKFTKIID